MKNPLVPVLMAASMLVGFAQADAQEGAAAERIAAAYVLTLGRVPAADEAQRLAEAAPKSVAEAVTTLRGELATEADWRKAVATKAGEDAFGRAPEARESTAAQAAGGDYTAQMKAHVAWLASHPADYEATIGRAYRVVIRREVYAEEIEYWKKQDTRPFVLLVGCLENWARRNQPGLMVTSGTATMSVNSDFVTTVRLSPEVAAEARAAAALPVPDGATADQTVVAAGATGIASNGRMHFVAAGAPDLAAML